MNNPPSYTSYRVITTTNLIKVSLEGVWNSAIDIAYLTELSLAMRAMRTNPWGLAVDMRGWFVPEEVRRFKEKTAIHLDRRNQQAECWLVDDMAQANHLSDYIEKAGVPFKRCLDVSSANIWLAQYGFSL